MILKMFRAAPCSSSGGQILLLQPLVSSLSVNGRTACRLRADIYILTHPAKPVLDEGLSRYVGYFT